MVVSNLWSSAESVGTPYHGLAGYSMSEDVVTVCKEVFDDNSEPTDGGEEAWDMSVDELVLIAKL